MAISPMRSLYDLDRAGQIPAENRAYFEERLRTRLYDLIITEFSKRENEGLTQAGIAKRLGKRPEQINRWLSGPGNLTLDTVSSLLLAICDGELEIGVSVFSEQPRKNFRKPEWLRGVPRAANLTTGATTNTIEPEVWQDSAQILGNTPVVRGSSAVSLIRPPSITVEAATNS